MVLEHATPDQKENDNGASSVIMTPGPVDEPNTDDRAFIKRSSESESDSHAGYALMDDDPDYVSSEAGGTDGDEDD